MNETAQLAAMEAELVALGYGVRQDILGDKLGLELSPESHLRKMTLDLVGKLKATSDQVPERPHLVIIEVANRTRAIHRDGKLVSRREFVTEDDALSRFRIISENLAQYQTVDFQIRFFDVSADQFAARRMKKDFKVKHHIMERVQEGQWLLARSAGRDDLSRALVVARLWANWLRIVGNLHPGREHRELRVADLRTIQKDLFDHNVLEMRPYRYGILHRSLLAVTEGGDFEARELLELEPEVRALFSWATARYGGKEGEKKVEAGSLFDRLFLDIKAQTPGPRQVELIRHLMMLRIVYGTEAFAKRVAGFLLAIQNGPKIAEALITELLEQASQ
ncbi:MAG: hypothetical protein O9313_18765 [Acetobacteraceae bacterium]|jgi:hypothetical protein|nr:hypothetical protein [Acetobacteraceae bacterium]